MSDLLNFLISYKEEISSTQFHEIIASAAHVDCFVNFIPINSAPNDALALLQNFREQIDKEREIAFTICGGPYDTTSDGLCERQMLDEDGSFNTGNIECFTAVVQKFLLSIPGAERFLMVCSEGFDIRENFAVSEVRADQVAEYFTAVLVGGSIYGELPSLALYGRWGSQNGN